MGESAVPPVTCCDRPNMVWEHSRGSKDYFRCDACGGGMTKPRRVKKDGLIVDVSALRIEELMVAGDSPLLASLERLAAETDADAIAGFSQGMS